MFPGDNDDGRINFNVAYSPKTARTRNSLDSLSLP